jgi:hypothetical protein
MGTKAGDTGRSVGAARRRVGAVGIALSTCLASVPVVARADAGASMPPAQTDHDIRSDREALRDTLARRIAAGADVGLLADGSGDVLQPLLPAGVDEGVDYVDDPSFDVSNGAGDIIRANVSTDPGSGVTVRISLRSGPNWLFGESGPWWDFDTDLDDVADYGVGLFAIDGQMVGGVFDEQGELVCEAMVSPSPGTISFGAQFPRWCLGNPSQWQWGAAMFYDDLVSDFLEVDTAPDETWAGPMANPGYVPIAPAPPAPSPDAAFRPVTPARLVDTRSGPKVGSANGAAGPLVLGVVGLAGVPASGVGAVALNVTVDQGEAPTVGGGFVTVYPCGARPDASNLNFVAGQTVPNAVIAPVSASGQVCLYVYGRAHLIVDVSGYFPTGEGINTVTPYRLTDTRGGTKAGSANGTAGPLVVNVLNRGGLPASGVGAVALNVTVDQGEAPTVGGGFVTVYPCGARPDASNLNFAAGQTIPNAVVAPVSPGGDVCFYVYGRAHLIVDVSAYFATGDGISTVTPFRLTDTRPTFAAKPGRYTAGAGPYVVNVLNRAGLPASGVGAVALNVTVTQTEDPVAGGGFVSVYPCGLPPNASNLNFRAGQTVANAVIAPVSVNGDVCFYVYSRAHLIVDVSGYFTR